MMNEILSESDGSYDGKIKAPTNIDEIIQQMMNKELKDINEQRKI